MLSKCLRVCSSLLSTGILRESPAIEAIQDYQDNQGQRYYKDHLIIHPTIRLIMFNASKTPRCSLCQGPRGSMATRESQGVLGVR